MNTPYRKRFNENGEVTNPIMGARLHHEPNRRERRSKPTRFVNNRKTFHLTVSNAIRYHRVVQQILDKDGSIKRVGHYVLKLNK